MLMGDHFKQDDRIKDKIIPVTVITAALHVFGLILEFPLYLTIVR